MYLYCSEEPYYMDELLKKIRKSGEVLLFDSWPDNIESLASEETMFGKPNIVIRPSKIPTVKEVKKIEDGDREEYENVFLLVSPVSRKDLLGELFTSYKEKKKFKFYPKCSLDEKEGLLLNELKVSPSIVSCVYDAIDAMDLTEFHTRLDQLRPLVPDVTKEVLLSVFPPIVKTNPFKLVELIEAGDEKRAVNLIAEELRKGEEALKLLGILRSAYTISYKLALAPSRKEGVDAMKLPGFRAAGIPKLPLDEAQRKMKLCAECGDALKLGRNGAEALFSLVGNLI